MVSEAILTNIFCENLRRFRKLSGITQIDLAKRLGMTQGAYSQLERGYYSPSLATIAAVANAIGTQPELLITPQEKVGKSAG